MFAIYTTATGELVSVGTVIADPLPGHLTAVELSPADAANLQDGSWQWDPATHAVVPTPGWVDPEVIEDNRTTIEVNLAQDLIAMQTIIDTANATLNSSPAVHLKAIARNLRRLSRVALDQYDGTT